MQEQLEDVEDFAITADGWTSTKQKILKSFCLGMRRVYGSQ